MEIKIIKESMKEQWEEYINKNPYSIAWQSYEWSNVLRRHYKFDFYPVAAFEGSEIAGIFPLYHMKTLFSKDLLTSVPYAVAGGIVSDDKDVRKLLLDKAIEISREHNSCRITLKQYKVRIDGDLRTDENYYNRELGLSENIAEAWDKISEINRGKIDEGEKSNPVLRYPSEDIDEFYKLLLNHSHNNGMPCVAKTWIEDLIHFKMYSIAFIKVSGNIVAATMVKKFKDTVSFPFTCINTTDSRNRMFAYSLYWGLIRKFASEGTRIFHSGRIPETDLTDDYRLGWGGTKYRYYYQYYPDNMAKTEYAVKRGRKREIFESCWKLMPRSIVKMVGPHIVRQFP